MSVIAYFSTVVQAA